VVSVGAVGAVGAVAVAVAAIVLCLIALPIGVGARVGVRGKERKNQTKPNRPSQQTRFKTTNRGGCNKKTERGGAS
jgi:hypothetical protein